MELRLQSYCIFFNFPRKNSYKILFYMDLFFTFIGPNIYKQRESMCKKTWTLFSRDVIPLFVFSSGGVFFFLLGLREVVLAVLDQKVVPTCYFLYVAGIYTFAVKIRNNAAKIIE